MDCIKAEASWVGKEPCYVVIDGFTIHDGRGVKTPMQTMKETRSLRQRNDAVGGGHIGAGRQPKGDTARN